jgi:[acyl-carrier-protein] S-malonyltransferase
MYRLLSEVDGDAVHDVETGCDKLARQICTLVDWMARLESCREAEAVRAFELGPGTALSRMAAPYFSSDSVRSRRTSFAPWRVCVLGCLVTTTND